MAQRPQEIRKALRDAGQPHRPADVTAEWKQQIIDEARAREDAILANADNYPAELVDLIREHRAAGKYTAQGGAPRS